MIISVEMSVDLLAYVQYVYTHKDSLLVDDILYTNAGVTQSYQWMC